MSLNYQPGILGENSDYRLHSHIKYLKGIKRAVGKDGSITERLLFERGEIVLVAKHGSLEAYSIAYRPGKKPEVTCPPELKTIRRGISPSVTIDNAKSYIMPRLEYFDKIRAEKEAKKQAENEHAERFTNFPRAPEPIRGSNSLLEGLEVNVRG